MGPKRAQKGPGRASKGSRDRLRFIWTKFQPKWAHLGPNRAPFSFSISPKPILGPNSSKSSLGPWPIRAPGPLEAEGRHFGGRRPTFWRGVGRRSRCRLKHLMNYLEKHIHQLLHSFNIQLVVFPLQRTYKVSQNYSDRAPTWAHMGPKYKIFWIFQLNMREKEPRR